MTQTRRDIMRWVSAGVTSVAGLRQSAWAQGRYVPTEADYFNGTALDHGIEYRRTNMALIPREYRPQITREIIDPEPGRIVIDSREHFLYLTARRRHGDPLCRRRWARGFSMVRLSAGDAKGGVAHLDAASRDGQA